MFLVPSKSQAWETVARVDDYLQENLGLELNEKTAVTPVGKPVEFGGRNKVRDIAFEEDLSFNSVPTITFDDVQVPIPIINQEVNLEPQQDNVE